MNVSHPVTPSFKWLTAVNKCTNVNVAVAVTPMFKGLFITAHSTYKELLR